MHGERINNITVLGSIFAPDCAKHFLELIRGGISAHVMFLVSRRISVVALHKGASSKCMYYSLLAQ